MPWIRRSFAVLASVPFKISPSVGTLIADLVTDGKSREPDVPESDFRLSRFAEGVLLRSPHPYQGAGEIR